MNEKFEVRFKKLYTSFMSHTECPSNQWCHQEGDSNSKHGHRCLHRRDTRLVTRQFPEFYLSTYCSSLQVRTRYPSGDGIELGIPNNCLHATSKGHKRHLWLLRQWWVDQLNCQHRMRIPRMRSSNHYMHRQFPLRTIHSEIQPMSQSQHCWPIRHHTQSVFLEWVRRKLGDEHHLPIQTTTC